MSATCTPVHKPPWLRLGSVSGHYRYASPRERSFKKCVICFKAKPRLSEAIMGSLPSSRVTPSKPFAHCGVDYAGPVTIREGKRRNARDRKAYIAIFVCFATKTIHIEVVSDLITDSFLGAFKRFIARRGKPNNMYSDNGTTFVGAQKQLKELYEFYRNQETQSDLNKYFSEQGITWVYSAKCTTLWRTVGGGG